MGNSFDNIQIQVPSLELLLMYKTIQVPACVSKIKSKEKLFYLKQYLEIQQNEIQKKTLLKTMNFLPIFISFEFNDFHDYKVLINSFTVYVYSDT